MQAQAAAGGDHGGAVMEGICAALDRQHPRDLFDVHHMMNNEGLTDDIRMAFTPFSYADFEDTRERLVQEINKGW